MMRQYFSKLLTTITYFPISIILLWIWPKTLVKIRINIHISLLKPFLFLGFVGSDVGLKIVWDPECLPENFKPHECENYMNIEI